MNVLTIPYETGRLAILADLHLDQRLCGKADPLEEHRLGEILSAPLDSLIIAGDVTDHWDANLPHAMEVLTRVMPRERIWIVPDNHDYYGGEIDDGRMAWRAIEQGANLVQMAELRHGMTRILGCTLWTDFELMGCRLASMKEAETYMADYSRIVKYGDWVSQLRPKDTADIHAKHLLWLDAAAGAGHFAGDDGQTAIVIHHVPHPDVAGAVDDLTPAYASNLDGFLSRHRPNAWFCGHSHRRIRATVHGADVRNVSAGYPDKLHPGAENYLDEACIWTSQDWSNGKHG